MEYPTAFPRVPSWLFCGIAIALGWGLRGEFGGSVGAALPGALLGLAVALTSGRSGWVRAAPVFGMAGALGIAPGGQMSYGLLVGYTKGIDVPNVAYGYAIIGLVGGLWGAFGAGCLGLVASRVKYRTWQIIAFVIGAIITGRVLHLLLVDTIGLRVNPPRDDSWPEMLGAVIALLVFARIRRDPLPPRLVFWGFAAGSIGFMVGDFLQVVPSFLSPGAYNWWKLMEQSFGFILGAGIGWALSRETRSEPDVSPSHYALTVFGVIVCAWLVPVLLFNSLLERLKSVHTDHLERLAKEDETSREMLENASNLFAQFHLREFILLALIIAVAYALRRRTGKLIGPDFAAKLLFTLIMWFGVLVADVKMSVPVWDAGISAVHNGFLLMAVILTLWTWLGWPIEPAPTAAMPLSTQPPLRIIAPIYFLLVYPALAVLLALASIASHPGEWRDDAHKRFGEEPAADQQAPAK